MSYNEKLPHYVGKILPNCDYHHGQISPAIGVCSFGIARANRNIQLDDKTGYTYKHAPNIAYFNNRFYIQYLLNPKDEHTNEGISMLASSINGIDFDDFKVSFPKYKIKKCTVTDYKGNTTTFCGNTYAYMHQRMGFYQANNGKMLVLGFYGFSPFPYICNWDNYGIGRCVREIKPDNTLGEIYFIRYNKQSGFTKDLLNYPLYNECQDKKFIEACEELLSNKLYTQMWAEEHGDFDELTYIKHNNDSNQAFCFYHIDEKTVVGLWKNSKSAISYDNGESFTKPEKVPSLVMSGQKVFAQKINNKQYNMVYIPSLESQHRYPLCLTTSKDGIKFDNMLLIDGEVPPMKYEGFWKDFGPQYVHGITEGIDTPNDNNMWITYSVNKEDIFISKIPNQIKKTWDTPIFEDFSNDEVLPEYWNIYSPCWSKVRLVKNNNKKSLGLYNKDLYNYSKALRVFKEGKIKNIEFSITPKQNNFGIFQVEISNEKYEACFRIKFKDDSKIYLRTTTDIEILNYNQNVEYNFKLVMDCNNFTYKLYINNQLIGDKFIFIRAVDTLSIFTAKTGENRYYPNLDTRPEDVEYELKNCDIPLEESGYLINYFICD